MPSSIAITLVSKEFLQPIAPTTLVTTKEGRDLSLKDSSLGHKFRPTIKVGPLSSNCRAVSPRTTPDYIEKIGHTAQSLKIFNVLRSIYGRMLSYCKYHFQHTLNVSIILSSFFFGQSRLANKSRAVESLGIAPKQQPVHQLFGCSLDIAHQCGAAHPGREHYAPGRLHSKLMVVTFL